MPEKGQMTPKSEVNQPKKKIVCLRTHIMRFGPVQQRTEEVQEKINAWMQEMCIKQASPMLHSKTLLADGWLQYDFYYTVMIEA